MKIRPQSAESFALIETAVPNLRTRLDTYRVIEGEPDVETMLTFNEYLGELVGELAGALAAGNLALAAKNGHALKGMGGAVGAPEISVLGEQLERAAKSGDAAASAQLADVLKKWFQRTAEAP